MARKPILLIAILTVMLALSASTTQQAHSQTADVLPPNVIDVYPPPGAELNPTDTVTITFDQPMNQASVAQALSLTPTLTGDLTWTDAQTVNFVPKGGWLRSHTYTLTLSTTATAANGLTFAAPFTAKLTTLSNLTVAQVTPANDAAEVAPGANIVVSFNRPVIALGAATHSQNLITFDPPIQGSGTWINTALYEFTPAALLPLNTRYTAHIARNLQAVDGAQLEADYTWTFRTLPPRVLQIVPHNADKKKNGIDDSQLNPKSIALDQPLIITFSEAMNHASTEAAFSLVRSGRSAAPPIRGTFSWNADSTQLTFTPTQRMALDSDYHASIAASARTKNGTALADNPTVTLHTQPPPAVLSTSPANGATGLQWGSVSIQFNVPLKIETGLPTTTTAQINADIEARNAAFKAKITLSPSTEFNAEYYPEGAYVSFIPQPNTTYTITVKKGLMDAYGNPIANDYTFSFTTNSLVETHATSDSRITPNINGDLMITDAALPNTSVDVDLKGSTPIKFDLYRLPPTQLGTKPLTNHQTWEVPGYYAGSDYGGNGTSNCGTPPTVQSANLIRAWTVAPSTSPTVPLVSDKGGKLAPGLYWLTMGDTVRCSENRDHPDADQQLKPESEFGLAVVTANMTVKRGTEDVFVWLTQLKDSSVVPGAIVNVYSGDKLIASGTADAKGAIRLPVRVLEHPLILITAEAPGMFAAWYNYYPNTGYLGRRFDGENGDFQEWAYQPPVDNTGYIYTDRPIYRPGDTVYFRGVLRNKRDVAYPVPDQSTALLDIGAGNTYYGVLYIDSTQPKLQHGTVALSDFGTFDGTYKIPADGKPGSYYVKVALKDAGPNPYGDYYPTADGTAVVSFTVASYHAADFEVKVTTSQPTIFAGDPLQATIQASYYAGGAVSKVPIDWNTTSETVYDSFNYNGAGSYNFGYSGYYNNNDGYDNYDESIYAYSSYGYGQPSLATGTVHADSAGRAIVTTSTASIRDSNAQSNNNYAYPQRITLEGTVSDESGQAVSGRASVIAYPTDLYIGVNTPQHLLHPGDTAKIDVLSVTAHSAVRPYQALMVHIDQNYWINHAIQQKGSDSLLTADANGKAQFTFTVPQVGWYTITFSGKDDKGRPNTTYVYLYAADSNSPWYSDATDNAIRPVLTTRDYKVGAVADVLFPVPFAGASTALITVERAGVLRYDVVPVDGPTLRYQVPITDDFAPTAYVKALFISKPDADHPYPQYRVTVKKRINVDPASRRLTITLTPSTRTAKPGEKVTFDVFVTNAKGQPVHAEVGLALVDKAVLALLPPNSGTLEQAFFGFQTHQVYTDLSLDGLLQSFKPDSTGPDGRGGGGGGGGGDTFSLRQSFETTPLWAPHVVTGTDGHASVSVTLPDNLTTWQLDARALTADPGGDLKVGQATTEIVASLPLIVRPVAPRFFVVGDQVQLAAVINNTTDHDVSVTASLDAKGVHMQSARDQVIRVAANGRARVVWPVTILDSADNAGVDLSFYAISADGLRDAAKPSLTTGPNGTIPVYRYTVRDAGYATSGILRQSGSQVEAITLPPRYSAASGDLVVRLDPSLSATLADSFTYLQQYPYFCIEQTVSRFLPNVTTYHALHALGLSDPTLEAGLQPQIDAALAKLIKEQKPDGSWGWYPGMETDPLTTAYAALGLIETRKAGFTVDSGLLDKAVAYVQTQIGQPLGTDNWRLNRQAFYVYVLARNGAGEKSAFETLYNVRTRMSIAGRAYLLMAYEERFSDDSAIKSLTNDLITSAVLGATGTYWQEAEPDWWNWGTDTRTTALALNALIRVMPDSDLLPNIVRWLMAVRQTDHWATTQETVWSISALTEWMLHTGELHGAYAYNVLFGGKNVGKATVTPDSVRQAQTLRIAVKNLLAGHATPLTIARGDGDGALYYTAHLDLQVPAAKAPAVSQGVSIQRQYFTDLKAGTAITHAHVGDLITVRLTVNVPHDVRYFALEDTFPAGAEGVDTSLLTTTQTAESPAVDGYSYSNPYWFWGWNVFQQIEMRDSQIHLYADSLRAGTYVYTYQVRASVSGVYQTLPSYGYSFYFPELFGRSAGSQFVIEDAPTR